MGVEVGGEVIGSEHGLLAAVAEGPPFCCHD